MMLRFPLFLRSRHGRPPAVQADDFVVARPVSASPSEWVFFDGTETQGHGSGQAASPLPGVAFFIDEAWSCADPREAQATASRLNMMAVRDGAAAEGEPWIAIGVRNVISSLPTLPPMVPGPRNRSGGRAG
ncbi:MAG: hypothetical protein AB1592_05235 [Pseudomonadota bacterium]